MPSPFRICFPFNPRGSETTASISISADTARDKWVLAGQNRTAHGSRLRARLMKCPCHESLSAVSSESSVPSRFSQIKAGAGHTSHLQPPSARVPWSLGGMWPNPRQPAFLTHLRRIRRTAHRRSQIVEEGLVDDDAPFDQLARDDGEERCRLGFKRLFDNGGGDSP